MALAFDGTKRLYQGPTSNYTLDMAIPYSLHAVIRPNVEFSGITQYLTGIFRADGGNIGLGFLTHATINRIIFFTGGKSALMNGAIIPGQWQTITGATDAINSRRLMIDAGVGNNSNNATNFTYNYAFTIGCGSIGGGLNGFDGDIALVAYWEGVGLTQADHNELRNGVPPEHFYPEFLKYLYRCDVGDIPPRDFIGGQLLTAQAGGAVGEVDGPPRIYPATTFFFPIAAVPSNLEKLAATHDHTLDGTATAFGLVKLLATHDHELDKTTAAPTVRTSIEAKHAHDLDGSATVFVPTLERLEATHQHILDKNVAASIITSLLASSHDHELDKTTAAASVFSLLVSTHDHELDKTAASVVVLASLASTHDHILDGVVETELLTTLAATHDHSLDSPVASVIVLTKLEATHDHVLDASVDVTQVSQLSAIHGHTLDGTASAFNVTVLNSTHDHTLDKTVASATISSLISSTHDHILDGLVSVAPVTTLEAIHDHTLDKTSTKATVTVRLSATHNHSLEGTLAAVVRTVLEATHAQILDGRVRTIPLPVGSGEVRQQDIYIPGARFGQIDV